jgi:nucleoside-diphosphate-sugar epimerase
MISVIQSEEDLDRLLTEPRAVLTDFIRTVSSPLLILGAGGKMGPTLAVLAHRAAAAANHPLEIIAVSRFSDPQARVWLEQRGVKTLSLDLLHRNALNGLPDSPNLIYLAGMKFGTIENPSLTWAVNTLVPAHVCDRYPAARIVALSTGNVYPFVPVNSGGAAESQPCTPLGEYANAAVARERLFEHFSRLNGTRIALMRLNYAVDLRYGVLADIARKVWTHQPVDLSNAQFNCIWQGDANEMILRSLALASTPASPWNLTGPVSLNVRKVAERFAELLGRNVRFTGMESDSALLSNPSKLCAELGPPPTPTETMISWVAHWVKMGGRDLNKPTHFEVRDGAY